MPGFRGRAQPLYDRPPVKYAALRLDLAADRMPPARFAFLDHSRPIAFAHRGGAMEAEENTWPAFQNAVTLGYRHIETDVQASRDGVAVIFHDDTLERLTGRPDAINALQWPALAQIVTRGGNGLVRLDDLLSAFPDCCINLEPKSDAAVEPIAEAVRRCGALERVCVGCFDQRRVDRMRTLLGPDLCWSPAHLGVARLWLSGFGLPAGELPFPVVQVPPVWGPLPVVTARFVAAAHARNIDVHVWTVDTDTEIDRFIDLGVDGIMTDRPSLLKAALERRGLWPGS
jgi:glycerophosphoryl diester phosphodiesterase